jgi:hypothetical protein
MNTPSSSCTRPAPTSPDADALLALPFPVFVCSIARLLVHLGYQEVAIKKPLHGSGRGRNSQGGLDIEAYRIDGLSRLRVIVQVKQHAHPVPRSFVDELRGAMVRHGALQGLLFTAGTFSPTARLAALYATNSLPVRLIDGAELARLLTAKEVPIRADTSRMYPDRPRPTHDGAVDPLAPSAPLSKAPAEDVPQTQHSTPSVTITLTIDGAKQRIAYPPTNGA